MACINWPGTFQCVDSAIMNGGSTHEWFMMNALNRDYYEESLTKCDNHNLPTHNLKVAKSVYVDDFVFMCGSYNKETKRESTDCTKLNLVTKAYESMAPLQKFRRHFSINYVEDKIYAIGGIRYNGDKSTNPSEITDSGTKCENSVEEYDIEFNTWTFTTPIPDYGIQRHCSVVVDYRIFVMGGDTCVTNDLNTVWKFDTRDKTWSLGPTKLPYPVYDLGCSTMYLKDGRFGIMIAGGLNYHTAVVRKKVYFLDLANEDGPWEEFPDLPVEWYHKPNIMYLGK